jgi:hypothetical protein
MKQQNIVIKEPGPFYSPQDEDYFFEWLQSISEVKEVSRVKGGLQVTIEEPVNEGCLADLMAVLSRYSVGLKPLKALCAANNEKWFRDPLKYWYLEIFGDEIEDGE